MMNDLEMGGWVLVPFALVIAVLIFEMVRNYLCRRPGCCDYCGRRGARLFTSRDRKKKTTSCGRSKCDAVAFLDLEV